MATSRKSQVSLKSKRQHNTQQNISSGKVIKSRDPLLQKVAKREALSGGRVDNSNAKRYNRKKMKKVEY